MALTSQPVLMIAGLALPNSAPGTPQFTAAKPHVIKWLSFTNTDTSDRTVTVHLIPSGESTGVATTLLTAYTIPAGSHFPVASSEVINTGYTIQLTADVADKVRASVSGVSFG